MPCALALCFLLFGVADSEPVADPARVAAIYTKRYHADPNDYKNAYVLGLASFAQGSYARAVALFESAARLTPDAAAAAYAQAMSMRAMGDAPGALQALRMAVKKKGATFEMWFELGQAALAAGDMSAASAAFGEAVRQKPRSVAASYNAGVAWLRAADLPAAKRVLQHTTEMAPDFSRAWHGLGVVATLQEQTAEALTLFRRASASTPLASYNLGVTAMRAGDFTMAVQAYAQAVHADPNMAQAHSNLGVMYDVLAEKEAALQSFLRVTELLPDFVDGAYNLGLAHFRQGQLPLALAALQRVVRRQPNHADAWVHIGEIYLQLGQPRRGQAALKTAAQKVAYGGAFSPETGARLLRQGRFAEALQLYYQRVVRAPKSLADYTALTDAAVATKQWQMAIWALGEAINQKSGDRGLRRRLVETLVMAGDLARARQEAQRGVAAWPDSPEDWATLGQVDWRLGDLDQAENSFHRALALAPEHQDALVGLARTYFARADATATIALLEPRARGAAQSAALDSELGFAYRCLGQMEKSARWFERALADGPASAAAWLNLGVAQFAADHPAEARRAFAQALRLDANLAEAYYFLAVMARRAGYRSEAISQVRIALRLDATHAEAQRLLAALGNVEE